MLEVSENEISARLAGDNPWWSEVDNQPEVSTLKKRHYFQSFKTLVEQQEVNRAIILMGPRRVGKTVMLHQLVHDLIAGGQNPKSIIYAAIDTPTFSGIPLEKLIDIFCARNEINKRKDKIFVLFDEIQYLKQWENHLKVLVDKFQNIKFVASGSAAAALKLKSYESGAGRFSDFMLPPLTFAEYLHFIDKEKKLLTSKKTEDERYHYETPDINDLNKEFINYVNFGGYPEAVFVDGVRDNPSRFIKSDIIDKVLLRDLPSLYGIDDIQELNRLFTSVAYNTGREISLKELSSASGVASQTIKRYLEYLEAAFLISRVRRIDQHGKNFKRERGFKVYLTNPSMRAALFQRASEDSEFMGQLAETAIFSQWSHSRASQISYARWDKGEVDIVGLDSLSMKPRWAVEVKWSDRFFDRPSELKSLFSFAHQNDLPKKDAGPILVTTRSKSGLKECEGVPLQFVPTSLYCYAVGKNLTRRIW